jgi:aryl-alcohol dehydrogenase-like predicted oxidoreductase
MAELVREGKVSFLGICNCTVAQLDAVAAVAPVDVVQPPLSMIRRAALGDTIPWAAAHGSGVLAYSPMQSGILTGSFHERVSSLADGDWRHGDPEFQEPRLSRNLDLVARLEPIAGRLGASVAELAIAWVLACDGVSAAIVGARRPVQVDGWLGAAAVQLDDEAMGEIAFAIAESGAGGAEG